MPAVAIYGTPVPKGSARAFTDGRGRAYVTDQQTHALAAWSSKIRAASADLAAKYGRLDGPLSVCATFTVDRPKTVRRDWPVARGPGDLDKLCRAALDGLTAGGLIGDDSQIVHLDAWRAFTDTPGAPDRLPRPGLLLRIETLT